MSLKLAIAVACALWVEKVETYELPDGEVGIRLTQPMTLLVVPTEVRTQAYLAGASAAPFTIAGLVAFVQFVGADSGQHSITWEMQYPNGEMDKPDEGYTIDWQADSFSEPLFITFNGQLFLRESGLFNLNVYVDGYLVCRIPLIICWADQVDTALLDFAKREVH